MKGGDYMKLVWDNGSATVEAPKKCRSGFPNAPSADRVDFNRFYHIGRFGAWQMQADIHSQLEEQKQSKRDAVMDLIDDWTT
jgi:hypothetical protein